MSKVLNFLKKNLKVVVVSAVALVLVGGMTAALLVTNVGINRGGERTRRGVAMAAERSESGSSERRTRERAELTEEQIEQRTAEAREKLAQRLADGTITQEEYNEKIEMIENGEFPRGGRSKGSRGCDDPNCERNIARAQRAQEE